LKKKYDSLADEADRVAQAAPKAEDFPSLLIQLEDLSSKNGLILDNVVFKTIDDSKDKKISPAVAEVKVTAADLSLNGSQDSFKTFLRAVEANLRIMDVSYINFSEQKSNNASGQDFKVSLTTYYR